MQPAPLRQVPSRPPGAIAPAEAVRFATRALSGLDEPAAEAFALIALVGRSRQELGSATGMPGEELADALARARKALRRQLHPLPGSGWCERAERLISDRIDGALPEPGPARLGAHLANCSRCVEHERRLTQAQDALVADFLEARSPGEPEYDAGEPEPAAIEVPARLAVLPSPPRAPSAPARPALPVTAARVEEPPDEIEARPAEVVVAPPPPAATPSAPLHPPPTEIPRAPEPSSAPPRLPPQVVPPAAPRPPVSTPRAPAPWHGTPPARPALAARAALEAESTWTMVGPLVVVLILAVMVFVLAGVLATGA